MGGDTNGNTALHYCVICDDGALTTEICRYMMRYRLNVNETNKFGHTPASLALYLGKKEALQSLVDLVGKDNLQFKPSYSKRRILDMLRLELIQDPRQVQHKILNETTEACRKSRQSAKKTRRPVTSQSSRADTPAPTVTTRPSTVMSRKTRASMSVCSSSAVTTKPPSSSSYLSSGPPEFAPKERHGKYSWKHSMLSFIDILGVQTSQSYRPPAVVPPPPPTPAADDQQHKSDEDEDQEVMDDLMNFQSFSKAARRRMTVAIADSSMLGKNKMKVPPKRDRSQSRWEL